MRIVNFEKNHNRFEIWLATYWDLIERLIKAKKIIKNKFEKLELVEALVLRCAVRWEVLVENDIIISIGRDSSAYAENLGLRLRKRLTSDESKAIIIGHRYLDFKSVGDIKSFGKKYLVLAYNPFKAITPQMAEKIDEFLTMRNLLSHYSTYAWRSYKGFMGKRYFFKRIPEPGTFLLAKNPRSGNYRWLDYMVNFLNCSEKMRQSVR
jgi:hypothetical protein